MVFGDIHLWRNAGYLVAGQNELGQVDCVPPVVGVVGVHGDAGDHALHLLRVQLHQGPDLVGHADQPPVAEVQLARPPGLLHHLGVEVLGVLAAVVQGTFTLITIFYILIPTILPFKVTSYLLLEHRVRILSESSHCTFPLLP